jgi:hypothetical protein
VKKTALGIIARGAFLRGDEVDERIASFMLGRLTRGELKWCLHALRRELAARSVAVSVAAAADLGTAEDLSRGFGEGPRTVSADVALGGGFLIRAGDDLIDASVKGYLNATIERLRKQWMPGN